MAATEKEGANKKNTKDSLASFEFDTAASLNQITHKQDVIEFNHVAPTKVMTMSSGVELIEKNKSVKGDEISIEGQLRLTAYRKLVDPRSQLVESSLNKRAHERAMLNQSTEDPYRSFRRGLIAEARGMSARGPGTANSRNRAHTSMSKASRGSKHQEPYMTSLNAESEDGGSEK